MLDFLMAPARHLRQELRARRELRELLQQDDRILLDVGLTRAGVESELARPIVLGARHEASRLARLSLLPGRAL